MYWSRDVSCCLPSDWKQPTPVGTDLPYPDSRTRPVRWSGRWRRAPLGNAVLDSTADRVTDGLLLCGVALHLADTKGGTIMLLPMAVLATASLISYERAKAELLGYEAKGGLMERAERMVAWIRSLFRGAVIPCLDHAGPHVRNGTPKVFQGLATSHKDIPSSKSCDSLVGRGITALIDSELGVLDVCPNPLPERCLRAGRPFI